MVQQWNYLMHHDVISEMPLHSCVVWSHLEPSINCCTMGKMLHLFLLLAIALWEIFGHIPYFMNHWKKTFFATFFCYFRVFYGLFRTFFVNLRSRVRILTFFFGVLKFCRHCRCKRNFVFSAVGGKSNVSKCHQTSSAQTPRWELSSLSFCPGLTKHCSERDLLL